MDEQVDNKKDLKKFNSDFLIEQERKRRFAIISYTVIGVVSTVVFVLIFALKVVNIEVFHEERGLYADCSKRENKSNPYCAPKVSPVDKEWRSLSGGKKAQFSITD